jgi:hypothetical protein
MNEVTHSDLLLVFKAAAQMARVDSIVVDQETLFLKKLAQFAKISPEEGIKVGSSADEDVEELAYQLSSPKAKKLFLLAVATMAKADQHLSEEELNMLEELTLKLKIGRVKIKEMSYEACEEMVLKLLAQSVDDSESGQKESGSGDNFSDLDML